MAQNRLVADLHLHSRYSLATSPQLDLETLAATAVRKGIDLLAAPDFTHPAWREEMRRQLEPVGGGVFRLKEPPASSSNGSTNPGLFDDYSASVQRNLNFILVTEISCIWHQGGRSRRVHVLLMAPSFEAADRISAQLATHQDLESDGRPMIKAR